MERTMTQRWMVLIAVVGLIPLLLAMRPVDEALLAAASKGDLGEITEALSSADMAERLAAMGAGA